MRIRATVLASPRIWAIALFLFGTVPAFAANPHPMSESRALQLSQDVARMQRTVLNLTEMTPQASEVEALYLLQITKAAEPLTAASEVLQLAVIYQHMTCENDKAFVARVASIDLEAAKGYLDTGVTSMNGTLIHLRSPAAVAEARGLRDRMQELRQELDQYHY